MKPYYDEDGITIYHGDCRELEIPDGAVILTDPPYATGQKMYDVYQDTMPEWLGVMTWLLNQTAPMAFTMSHSRLCDLPKRPQWIGCWDKVFTGGIMHIGASPTWEPICFYNLPRGDRGRPRWDDVFRYPPNWYPLNVKRDPVHPCQKPVNLYKKLIAVLPDGEVVDPMMGSGTTLRAAKDCGRRAIGVDLSEKYCEIAAKRLAQGVLGFMPESTGCHHCDETMPNGRCWWCGGPNIRRPEATEGMKDAGRGKGRPVGKR